MKIKSSLFKYLLHLLLGLVVASCGVTKRGVAPADDTRNEKPVAASVSESRNVSSVTQQLWGAHDEWEGTPYVLGGNGINGVDCSSFTQIVFRDFFGEDLPRNTRDQLQQGKGIRRKSIRPGDLIFFRTGRGVLHVGIAMEDGDFMHASTSSGVMISNLSERYWAARYLGARRIL